MKGGARARSGPAPNPNSLRQDAGEWTHLPAEGREGAAPEWPLALYRSKTVAAREAAVWEREWHRPQAVMWERLHLETEVALYVRALVHAEKPRSDTVTAADRTLVRQLLDDLGISVAGLAKNRWIIDADESAQTSAPVVTQPARSSARDRFEVLNGTGGG